MPLPYSYEEKDLGFNFPTDLKWEELDKQGVKLPTGMSLVDLVIERENDTLLIEIKDPSHPSTPQHERSYFLRQNKEDDYICKRLVPKFRDSYTFLHLMERDGKPFKYIVLLGLEAFTPKQQKGLLGTYKDRLLSRVKQETDRPWKRDHIKDCVVLTVEKWNSVFREWPVTRISSQAS